MDILASEEGRIRNSVTISRRPAVTLPDFPPAPPLNKQAYGVDVLDTEEGGFETLPIKFPPANITACSPLNKQVYGVDVLDNQET